MAIFKVKDVVGKKNQQSAGRFSIFGHVDEGKF